MSFVDFPPRKARMRRGTIVIVALDPVASLAALNDAAVEEAAGRMATRKRLAIANEPLAGRPDVAFHRFYPIGRGYPSEPWAAVAILPATSHPDGRAPVSVSGTLPFGDAYVHTAHSFHGVVSRIYTSAPSDLRLSLAETAAVFRAQAIDHIRMHNEVKRNVEDAHGLGEVDNDASKVEPLQAPLLTFMDPHYQIWLNVDDLDELADPSTLEAELEQLRAIEGEWRRRRTAEAEAKDERLAQWRKALTNEGWEVDEDEYVMVRSVASDDCLAPEDAIDEPVHVQGTEDEGGAIAADRAPPSHESPPGQGRSNQGECRSEPTRSDCALPDAVDSMFAASAWDEQNPLEASTSLRVPVIDRRAAGRATSLPP